MKKGKIRYRILLIILFVILIICNQSYGAEMIQLQDVPYTQEYLDWLELPEEERNNTKMPRMIDIVDNGLQSTRKSRASAYSLVNSYDLRDSINMTVRDQKSTNECWAFAAIGSLETNLQLTKNITVDLSERHMDYSTSNSFTSSNQYSFGDSVNTGGNCNMAYSYLTNGMGAIKETDMPFSESFGTKDISYIQGKQVITKVEDYVLFPSINENTTDVEKEEIMQQIKQHIMNYGAVIASVYGEAMYTDSPYYNETYSASYYNSTEGADHDIIIVGWDDNFSRTKFNSSHRPASNGAWIVRNSWGTSDGDNGYFYISYEDVLIGKEISGIQKSEYGVDYNNLYQYDELGASGAVEYGIEKIYAANVFKKNSTQIEQLTEISVNLYQDTYCKVYVNPKNSDKSIENLIEGTKEYTLCSAGYHTIELDKPLAITGEEFVVLVEYYVPNGRANATIENKNSKTGESYISAYLTFDSNWADISTEGKNATIKAFTNNTPSLNVLSIGNITQSTNPIYNEIGGKINIPITTNSIADGATLDISIKKDDQDVTNKFTITGNSVSNNLATIGIQALAGIAKGTYQVEITYGSLVKKTTSFTIEEYIHVTSISLNQTNINLRKLNTSNLTVTVNPNNAINKNVNITSTNPNVASVSENGVITALSRGTTKITVKSEDGNKTAECIVNVIDPEVNYGNLTYIAEAIGNERGNITIPVHSIDVNNNTNINTSIKFNNQDVTNKFTITGNTINDNGTNIKIVIPMEIDIGMYTIELSDSVTGITTTKEFEVRRIELDINNITQSHETIYNEIGGSIFLSVNTIGVGDGETLGIKVLKGNNDVTSNFVVSSNVINNNQATLQIKMDQIEEGEYKIQVSYSTFVTKETTFNVEKYIHVENIELNKTEMEIRKGASQLLEVTISPENALNKTVKITNSNPNVVTIGEDGRIVALERGETVITAITEDGNKTKQCKIIVIDPTVEIKGIQYQEMAKEQKRGDIQIQANSIDVTNDTELEITISHNEQDVTDKFDITGNKIVNNIASISIKIPDDIEIGTYSIQAKFEDKVVCQSSIDIKEITVEIGEVKLNSEKIYEEVGGKITIPITSSNIENAESINVKIMKSEEDVTGKFQIIGNRLESGMANIEIQVGKDISAGKYKVEISYGDFSRQEVTFNIEEYIHVEKIILSKEQVNLKVGQTEKIDITINPENALNKNVIVQTNNPNVASINQDGTITAKSKGEAILTITSEDGNKNATCKVIVEEENSATQNNDEKPVKDYNNNTGTNNKNNNNNITQATNPKDTTIANKILPQTGDVADKIIIFASIITIIGCIIIYKKK